MNMIKKSVEEAINKQINAEFYSGYMYLSMAAYFESINLSGFANWMHVQALEEQDHGMKFYRYLEERGGRNRLLPIEEPPFEWNSPLDVFEKALEHEKKVTGMINDLVELARSEKDYPTENLLQWFVDEQVEEEATADEIVEKLKMVKDHPHALLMLDRDLGGRSAGSEEEE